MKEKINIAELLKDCPKGMELDCTVFDNITFDYVNTEQNRIYCKIDNRDTVWFTAKGCINLAPSAKCVIFPKGKTTWEGFLPLYEFRDGDIVSCTMYPEGTWIGIFKQYGVKTFESHCSLNTIGEFRNIGYKNHSLKGTHLATEEEKQKLFQAIKDNGYKWNAEIKTLEKLIVPKFKVGDRVTNGKTSITIGCVDNEYYDEIGRDISNILSIKNQDDWELVPNKFDITTLVPFESRLLARDSKEHKWVPAIWGCYDNTNTDFPYKTIGSMFKYCIPYNDDTKHLLGTTNDCDDFYKTWDEED